MAISRAQLLKELLPGLNALFGLEYSKYENEDEEIYETESSDRQFEEEVKLSGFNAAPVKDEGARISYDNAQESFTARYNHETIAMGFVIKMVYYGATILIIFKLYSFEPVSFMCSFAGFFLGLHALEAVIVKDISK